MTPSSSTATHRSVSTCSQRSDLRCYPPPPTPTSLTVNTTLYGRGLPHLQQPAEVIQGHHLVLLVTTHASCSSRLHISRPASAAGPAVDTPYTPGCGGTRFSSSLTAATEGVTQAQGSGGLAPAAAVTQCTRHASLYVYTATDESAQHMGRWIQQHWDMHC
jgi:hypothetical protein